MITRPEHVQQVTGTGGWDGRSWGGNRWLQHKETSMDWPEHQRIVCEARSLMVDRPDLGSGDARARFVTEAFFDLYMAYTANNVTLYVSKGIHQPNSNPHIQLLTTRGDTSYTFHLVVSATGLPNAQGRFRWVGTKFTVIDNRYPYSWPLGVGNAERRGQRQSMSAVQLQGHINQLREREAAERQRQQLAAGAVRDAEFAAALTAFHREQGPQGLRIDFGKTRPENVKSGKAAVVARGPGRTRNVKYDPAAKAFVLQ